MNRLGSAVAVVLALHACGSPERSQPDGSLRPAQRASLDESWLGELLEHRAEKDEELRTSATSPMAGTQYLPSETREEIHLVRRDGGFDLAYEASPEAVLSVARQPDGWRWRPSGTDVVCRAEDSELPGGALLPLPTTCHVGELTLSVYPREDSVTFIAFDPARPEMRAFEHLRYFPPDEAFAVQARLTRTAENGPVKMLTSQNLEKTFYRYARLAFALEGETYELTAFKAALSGEGSSSLFIPFKDATSGRETYGAGRFLEIPEPEGSLLLLDFNRAFNPLCNYSPAFNCPIPPRENRLTVAIRAGEKTYPHAGGH